MTDRFDRQTRSRMMAAVKSRDTRPEWRVRRFLHARGFRYRLHVKTLPGTPDIVLAKYRAAVFVHGCFWHRHAGCARSSVPKSNVAFWEAKWRANRQRDVRAREALESLGWRALVIWECETESPEALERLAAEIRSPRQGSARRRGQTR